MNVRPGGTTRAAKFSLPRRDNSSFWVHFRRGMVLSRRAIRWLCLSGGRRASKRRVSRRMPRKVRAVVGPSVFSVAMGTPRYAQTVRRISNRCWQMGDAGGPAVR